MKPNFALRKGEALTRGWEFGERALRSMCRRRSRASHGRLEPFREEDMDGSLTKDRDGAYRPRVSFRRVLAVVPETARTIGE